MTPQKQLIDYFPNYLSTDALFTKMPALGAPWSNEIGQGMDDAYFTMYSGVKLPSRFVTLHLNPDSDTANSLTIARILYGIYGESWGRLWKTFKADYVPLNNYSITEDISRTTKEDQTRDKDGTRNDTTNDTTTTTYGQTVDTTVNVKSYNHGFNSETPVPTAMQDDVTAEENGGSDTTTGNSSVATTTKDTEVNSTEGEETISRTRKGNVGQNTYQELMSQEIELWKWNFFQQVFDDVDTYLTLSIYSNCDIH